MQIYNQIARPVYEMLHLSDHVSIKWSNRLSTDEYPPAQNLTPISCVAPVIGRGPIKHKCPYCQGIFRIPSEQIIHVRLHTGEKPLVCNICGFRTVYPNSLVFHKGICTGQKRAANTLLRCQNCKFQTFLIKDFENHSAKCVTKPVLGTYNCTPCNFSTDNKLVGNTSQNTKT